MSLTLRIGCCGWGYLKPLNLPVKKFFPKQSLLQSYATIFDTVEINYTFYRIPQTKTVQKWRQEVDAINPDFEFTVKAFQIITHKLRFKDASTKYFDILIELCKILKSKVILFQSPSTFTPKEENLLALENFFKNINRENFTLVWESRGNWNIELIKELCKSYNLIHCVDPFRNEPIILKKQKTIYFRLHGIGEKMYVYKFNRTELIDLKTKLSRIPKESKTAYIFFNNTNCYEDAYLFKQMI
ncbi:MAG: hypothetical protein IGBAC_1097 [Ignavibacteriae bacterium]|nr:MAG: hypothetical protein IGBAC_1097 [Ignavibacteriota bacterium]